MAILPYPQPGSGLPELLRWAQNLVQQLSQDSTAATPSGTLKAVADGVVPQGWLQCDGSVVLRATYPYLFRKIGTTYNTGGEAGTEFRLPPNTAPFLHGIWIIKQ